MNYDEAREEASRVVQAFEVKINQLTATVAEASAQRDTTPAQIAAMEHLLVIVETRRDGYRAVITAFDRDDPARAETLLAEVGALHTRLAQWLGPP